MVCDKCHKHDATVHYTEVINSKLIKINLCQECAHEKGIEIAEPFSVAEFLSGIAAKDALRVEKKLVCPNCGLTLAAFKKKGRFGCAECYKTFEKVLTVLLKSIHKKTSHIGKKSPKQRKTVTVAEKVEKLKLELETAGHDEAFERAAELKDKIKKLKETVEK